VLYSNHIQPSVAAAIPRDWVCESPEELLTKFEQIAALSLRDRKRRVLLHEDLVRAFAKTRKDTLQNALAEVFR